MLLINLILYLFDLSYPAHLGSEISREQSKGLKIADLENLFDQKFEQYP